nr:methyltransferase-like protein 27 [Cherax quadricarinatus]
MGDGIYRGHIIAAEEVSRVIPEEYRQKVRVLDVAAGTGLVGHQLYERGFRNIDALEPSEGMMRILKDTDIYTFKYQEFIGMGQNTVPQDTYDVVVIAGGMGEGHVPVQGIDDMIRFSKPGGLVIIVMRLEFLWTVEEYKEKLEAHMDYLEEKGKWRKEMRKVVPNNFFDKAGVVFIYRVL